jgi:Thymidine kinase
MSVELIIGPMFSGKTTLLISKIEIHELTGKKCVIIRSTVDTRTPSVETHRNLIYMGNIMILKDFSDTSILKNYDVIGVDEGHFFEDLTNVVNFVIREKKLLFVSMLKSTFLRTPFPNTDYIYATATDITVCKAVCEICKHHSATNTKRREDIETTILVGGKEMYYPCCNQCWDV